jgi:hypothetical protein
VLVVEVFFPFSFQGYEKKNNYKPKIKFKAHLLLIYIYGCTKFIL